MRHSDSGTERSKCSNSLIVLRIVEAKPLLIESKWVYSTVFDTRYCLLSPSSARTGGFLRIGAYFVAF